MSKKKKTTGKTWLGASLAVLAAGTLLSYTQKSWPFQGRKPSSTPAGSGAGSAGNGSSGGAAQPVDVALTNEVAAATQSSPSTENDFTDEGATGNND